MKLLSEKLLGIVLEVLVAIDNDLDLLAQVGAEATLVRLPARNLECLALRRLGARSRSR